LISLKQLDGCQLLILKFCSLKDPKVTASKPDGWRNWQTEMQIDRHVVANFWDRKTL